MRVLTALAFPCVMMWAACGGGPSKAPERDVAAVIDSLEAILFADDGSVDNSAAAMMLVRNYVRFYQRNPSDSVGIDMLFKAGEVSMGLGDGDLAVKYFIKVAEEHPGFHKAPEALFLAGFCEENLNADLHQAEYFYGQFIGKYPQHPLTADAEFSKANLGMSGEELIRLFESRQQED